MSINLKIYKLRDFCTSTTIFGTFKDFLNNLPFILTPNNLRYILSVFINEGIVREVYTDNEIYYVSIAQGD